MKEKKCTFFYKKELYFKYERLVLGTCAIARI